ncbi:hypothetical protein [Shimia sp. R9_3]|uniref:hypothetical protein n=1 Tax=Shimia sp. R9_3 TaxID=2821113 RepID=UPI001ADA8799|nr:hypothetical protein [Shimia sp. R9_3]MBO9401169.1 hypothetical protein [Shimia sp. R9_3]
MQAAQSACILGRSSFENYLSHRIEFGKHADWLDSLDLTHLHQVSLSLGMQLGFGSQLKRSDLSWEQERTAMSLGFSVLEKGGDALASALEQTRQRRPSEERSYFTSDLGEFYAWLKSTEDDPATASLRGCVCDFISQNYPLQSGAKILGAEIRAPELVTLECVREEHGVGKVRVRGILAHLRGAAVEELADLQDIRYEDLDKVLQFWAGLQNIKQTAAQLHIHPVQVKALIRSKTLESHRFGTSLQYVTKSSVRALLTRLENLPAAAASKENIPLKDFCRRSQIPFARVISDWVSGKREGLSRDPDASGLAAILVCDGKVFSRRSRRFAGDLALLDAAAHLRMNVASVRRLRDGGYLTQYKVRNPETQHYRCYITESSIRDFEERFITLGQLAEQLDVAVIHLARALDKKEIETIPCDAGFVRAYPKSEPEVFQKFT